MNHKEELAQLIRKNLLHDVGWYLIPRTLFPSKENLHDFHTVMTWMRNLQMIKIGDLPTHQQTLFVQRNADDLVYREWSPDVQEQLMEKMIGENIIKPHTTGQNRADRLANVRNYINLLRKLGLAFVNKEKHLFVSPIGEEFLKANTQIQWEKIVQKQLLRLQFWNPSLKKPFLKTYQDYQVFPYLFTLEVLSKLPDHKLKNDEFALFVVYGKRMGEVDNIVKLINSYRKLDSKSRTELRKLLNKYGGYPKLAQAMITLQVFALTPTISLREGALQVEDINELNSLIKFYNPKLNFVPYKHFEDWYAYIGEIDVEVPAEDIVRYYTEAERLDEREEIVERIPEHIKDKVSFEELISQMVDEQLIESFLEKQVSYLEQGLKLVKNGRQYPTEVGPIDLLAKDSSGRFVVIELKKTRASDKVMGQILRYMGWVRINLSQEKIVRGIIVAREVPDKLKYAREGIQPPNNELLKLHEFTLNIHGKLKEVALRGS